MAAPFIFIATNRLKPGKLDAERARVPGLVEFIETVEPDVLAFNEYANEEGTEVAVVQVHPNTDSFEFHMEAVSERDAGCDDRHRCIRIPDTPNYGDAAAGRRQRSPIPRQAPPPWGIHSHRLFLS